MALALGAIIGVSAAGLKLVEPRAQAYPVGLLSALAADYTPWHDANPRARRLDAAIIAAAARDDAARHVTPIAGQRALVPLDLPPLPQAVGPEGQPLAAPISSPSPSPTARATDTATPRATAPVVVAPSPTSELRAAQRTSPALLAPQPTAASPSLSEPLTPQPPATDPPLSEPSAVAPALEPGQPTETVPLPTDLPPVTLPPTATTVPLPATTTVAPQPTPRPTRVRASATPTPTAVPPTATPTATPVPPTDTPTDIPTATPVPPTDTPTDTPTATPVPPTDTPTDTPTAIPMPPTDTPTTTPVSPELVVHIVVPSDGAIVASAGQTNFQAIAYDPAIGTNDGDGITSVDFSIDLISGSGTYSHTRIDTAAPYCAYGGSSACPMIANWNSMESGTYRLSATANAPGKPGVSVSVTFTKP